jgi:hypothetical protein
LTKRGIRNLPFETQGILRESLRRFERIIKEMREFTKD